MTPATAYAPKPTRAPGRAPARPQARTSASVQGRASAGVPGQVRSRVPAAPRTPLRLVAPRPFRAPRAPFVLLSLLVVALGLVGLLALNTVVAQDAFSLHDLQARAGALDEQEAALRRQLAQLDAPAAVAARAQKLGLLPAGDPVFLRQADGAILGNPAPVQRPYVPPPVRPSAPSATGTPKTSGSAAPTHGTSPAAAPKRRTSGGTAASPKSASSPGAPRGATASPRPKPSP